MSLIFANFANEDSAKRFAAAVRKRFRRKAYVFTDQAKADKHDPFPFAHNLPVVHVDRNGDYDSEIDIEAAVVEFGGEFVGT